MALELPPSVLDELLTFLQGSSNGIANILFSELRVEFHMESKLGYKYQESVQSSTTSDQWESNKLTVSHHKRKPRGQPFPSR